MISTFGKTFVAYKRSPWAPKGPKGPEGPLPPRGSLGGSLGVGFWGVGPHPGCEHSHGAGGARSESARNVEIRSVQIGSAGARSVEESMNFQNLRFLVFCEEYKVKIVFLHDQGC